MMLFIAFVLAVAAGCGSDDAAGTETATAAATTTNTDELTEEWLVERVGSKIGDYSLVRSVSITQTGQDKDVLVEVDRPEVCHDGAVVGTVATFAQNIMGILYKKYPEVANVEIIMYGVEQGVVSDEIALQVSVDRATAQKIDWFSFNDQTMLSLVSSYYIHPVIEESFRLEGGLPYDQQTQ